MKISQVTLAVAGGGSHQQQCRNNFVECYKSNDFFDKVERCFDIVAGVEGALHTTFDIALTPCTSNTVRSGDY